MSGAPALPAGFTLVALDSVGSTNDEARRLALGGAGHFTVVTAALQTAGRGRRGRAWVSPRGNLHCSLIVAPGRPLAEAAQLSFVAGLSLAEALAGLIEAQVACKWPNDVLVDGRKVAGMLLETVERDDLLVLGVGVDVREAPEQALHSAASLAEYGFQGGAFEVLSAFCDRFAVWFGRWAAEGFAPVREAWLERAAGLGATAEIRLPGETLSGLFAGLDGQGALLLDPPNGERRRVLAGDVFFGTR
ncbi:MAG: biotin--[acetyl-CoA-carboxylase] ligase [Alphaproteobacteria bacterium]|nr:biotin--[acetyl-CoA-carboxylase] ligase [Alphaproteobacteria bacterium]